MAGRGVNDASNGFTDTAVCVKDMRGIGGGSCSQHRTPSMTIGVEDLFKPQNIIDSPRFLGWGNSLASLYGVTDDRHRGHSVWPPAIAELQTHAGARARCCQQQRQRTAAWSAGLPGESHFEATGSLEVDGRVIRSCYRKGLRVKVTACMRDPPGSRGS